MRDLIKKVLREAVGVPSGIYETTIELYKKINKSIKTLEEPLFPEGEKDVEFKYTYDMNFKISDYEIDKINTTVRFIKHESVDVITLVSMSYHHKSSIEDSKVKTIIEDGEVSISITIAIPLNTEINDIISFFNQNKTEIVSSLSHELMHSYDDFKSKEKSLYPFTKYVGFQKVTFKVKPVDRFLFLIYFVHGIENVVRPSELFTNMKENSISSEEFYNFITSTKTWNYLKEAQNWSFSEFKDDLKNNIPDIIRVFDIAGAVVPHNEDDMINYFLRIIYINLINSQLDTTKEMLTTNFFEAFMGLSGDKEELFKKIIKKASKFENNVENFYLYEEKNFKTVSREVMKKISKLYSLTNKTEKTSILDWDLHHEINKTYEKIDKDYKYKKKQIQKWKFIN